MDTKDKISVLISEEELDKRIRELGEEISREYEGKELHLISILKGGVFFTCELAKRINVPVSIDFMSVSSYGSGKITSGVVKIIKDLDEDIEGKDVMVVEDIIDTGRTLALLKEQLLKRGPASLKICTAFDKPDRRVTELVPDYNGITIPDKFIVGYGLDLDGEYRNYDDIRVVKQE